MVDVKTAAFPDGWSKEQTFRLPKKMTIRCCIFWTTKTNATNDLAEFTFATARRLLERQNMDIEVCDSLSLMNHHTRLNGSDHLIDHPTAVEHLQVSDTDQVLRKAQQLHNTDKPNAIAHKPVAGVLVFPRVPVIFCPFLGRRNAFGEEIDDPLANGTAPDETSFPRYALVNTSTRAPDGVTLLHEIGHCAGLEHPDSEKFAKKFKPGQRRPLTSGPIQNILTGSDKKTHRHEILDWQIRALADAYFTREDF